MKAATFERLMSLYNLGDFGRILEYPNGLYFLKLRSMSRKEYIDELALEHGVASQRDHETNVRSDLTLSDIFKMDIPEKTIDEFIHKKSIEISTNIEKNKESLYGELFKLDVLDWGGLYQNGLERTIMSNYVKKTKSYAELNEKIAHDIHDSMLGYVRSSWYNHWSSILIENMFKRHDNVMAAIGKVKNIDFFWNDIPLDLKVTYFPQEFLDEKRKGRGLGSRLSILKEFARKHELSFNTKGAKKEILKEIYRKISESSNPEDVRFIKKFDNENLDIIHNTEKDPHELAQWLYEKQGERRFDRAYRLYLILVDETRLEESWKLKRDRSIVPKAISEFLSKHSKNMMLDVEFKRNSSTHNTKCFILFITKRR